MLKVSVRFTGKENDIEKIVDYMINFMDEDYSYKVLKLMSVSKFYPNRGSDVGRVYCDFMYDEEIYHGDDE